MPDSIFSTDRSDLIGAAEAGLGRVGAGNRISEDQPDVSKYASVQGRTRVPSWSTGQGPTMEELKKKLVIIKVEEEPDPILDGDGNVIEERFVTRTDVVRPGDPNHPFVQDQERAVPCQTPMDLTDQTQAEEALERLRAMTEDAQSLQEQEATKKASSPPPTSQTEDPPNPSESATPPKPTSSADNALLGIVLKLAEGLSTTQASMTQILSELRAEKKSPSPVSTEPSPGSHPSSEASASEPETSRASPSSSRPSSPSSTTGETSPPAPPASRETSPAAPASPKMAEPEVGLTWHTPHGQFSCKALDVAFRPLSEGMLAIVIYLASQEHSFVPVESEMPLMLNIRRPEDEAGRSDVSTIQVIASGIDFDLELGGVGYKIVVLTKVEQ